MTGAFDDLGGCAAVAGMWQIPCDQEFLEILISDECPVSCGLCPTCGDGSCDYHSFYGETYDNCPADCEMPPDCDVILHA